jgi:hypothetical protein
LAFLSMHGAHALGEVHRRHEAHRHPDFRPGLQHGGRGPGL